MLHRKGIDAKILAGKMKSKDKEIAMSSDIIVARYNMAGEGVDLPQLDTLIFCSPKKTIEQICGRILRKKNKHPPLIIDICDTAQILKNTFWGRLNYYKQNK